MNIVSEAINTALDFILPQSCILCGQETPRTLMCANCLNYMPLVFSPWCRVCGRPVVSKSTCKHCPMNQHIDHGRAFIQFIPPVNIMIHHLKYRNKKQLATFLGQGMALIIQTDPFLQQADVIIPVPLYWLKQLRRGYNQSSLLADVISANTHIPRRSLLKRNRHTLTQTKLTETARRKNVTGAFSVINNEIVNKRVILVDDVLTTGATVNECARVLREAGAAAVFPCVAAITSG